MQRSSSLIVAVQFWLDLIFHAQREAGNQRKNVRPPLIGLLIVFQREGQNNSVIVLITARQAPGQGANKTMGRFCATVPNQGQQLALSQITGLALTELPG